MDRIQHQYVDIRGVKLHVAEIGAGRILDVVRDHLLFLLTAVLRKSCITSGSTAVLFIHGFPEIWYSWRHQMLAAANAGYRAIAPDLRGYGSSEPHPEPEKASFGDFVEDTVALLDHFGIDKAVLVGKDFGSWPVYLLSLRYPTRVSGIVSLGVPFFVPKPQRWKALPEGFYIFRWKEPGRAEKDFDRFDVQTVWKNIYILFSRSDIPIAEKDKEIMDLVDPSTQLPPWLSNEDLAVYTSSYEKSGFDSPMQVPYKGLKEDFKMTNPRIEAPVLLIIGENDYFLKFPGVAEYIHGGEVRKFVSDLEIKSFPDGTHFIQEQLPDQINQLLISFIQKHTC